MDNNRLIQLLEAKIENIVRDILNEKKRKPDSHGKSNKKDNPSGTVNKSKSFKRQYKEIQKRLSDKSVNATGVMSKALYGDENYLTKHDAERSHVFKKKNKKTTPDGDNVYEFTPNEIGKIFNELP